MIVGCKSDRTTERAVSDEDARELAEVTGVAMVETSAKSGSNIELAFITMSKEIIEAIRKAEEEEAAEKAKKEKEKAKE